MPVVTIPLSLIGVCALLLAVGYSINLLTLLAMVLAIGLVVDDAIVVVENIHRHIEEGHRPLDAAIVGMKEITGPVVAMTLTLAAVLAPLGFIGGLTGALFQEFAFTLAGAVIISGVVALTITPMMSARLLKAGHASRFQRIVDRTFDRVANWYERRVSSSLDYRPITLIVVVALIAATGFMFTRTTSELAPEEDEGALFADITGPRYATKEYTQFYTDEIQRLTHDIPEVSTEFSINGFGGQANKGFYIWVLEEWAERERSQAEFQQEVQGLLDPITGIQSFAFAFSTLPGTGGGLPISVVIQSIHDAARVFEVAEEVRLAAQASGRFIAVQNSLAFDAPQVTVTIDRDRAAALNVPISEVGTTLGLLVGGGSIAQFDRESNSYDVITQVPREWRDNPATLGTFFVRAADGAMVPLTSVVEISTNTSPAAIEQFNQLNSATISALPLPGVSTGDGLAVIHDILRAHAARGLLHRLFRPVAARGDPGQHHPDRLRRGDPGHLPGARRPVRELPRPVHHPDVGAALDLRGDPAAQHRAEHAQHLLAGRADHPDRAHHQARHPDGGVRQPAARGARPLQARRHRRRRQDPAAPDPDDHRRHGAGRGAAAHRRGRRRRRPLLHGAGDLHRAA